MSRDPRPVKRRKVDLLSNSDKRHGAVVETHQGSRQGQVDSKPTAAGQNDFQKDATGKEESYTENVPNTKVSTGTSERKPPRSARDGAKNVEEAYRANRLDGSNVFQLQLDDLVLKDQLQSRKLQEATDQLLLKLKGIIETIPDSDPLPFVDAERQLIKKAKVATPFPTPRPSKDANYKLQYRKPSHINVVGSYPLKLTSKVKQELSVDMLVSMPADLFQEKDYLDYRYFYRRAYYIAHIAGAIKATGTGLEVAYKYLNGNVLQPVVRVKAKPSEDTSNKAIVVRIIPGVSEGLFSSERTLPTKNLIRSLRGSQTEESAEPSAPTSFYNGSLRSDMLFTSYLKLCNDSLKRCASFRDACTLGKTWLRRRGLGSTVQAGGFGNFEWQCLLALLIGIDSSHKGVLSVGYSSYQLFKAAIQFLTSQDLAINGYTTSPSGMQLPLPGQMPCFYDADRSHNLLYKMTPWSYRKLRREARSTVDALSSGTADSFRAIFLTGATDLVSKFDLVAQIPLAGALVSTGSTQQDTMMVQKLHDVLEKALTDRVRLINFDLLEPEFWPLISAPPSTKKSDVLTIGVVADPRQSSRAMDRGPSVDNKQDVKAYLKFWGQEKAVRMKFGNESPIETVKWVVDGKGPSVIQQIIDHVLQRHFGKEVAEAARYFADPFITHVDGISRPLGYSTESSLSVANAFTRFEKDLRSLQGLPLQIRHIQAVDPIMRHTQVRAVSSLGPPNTIEVNLQFEGSGRWPDDLTAIQYTKVAFLAKMKELYEIGHEGLSLRVGLESRHDPSLNQSYLDVGYAASRLTFRVRIHHERELALLERNVKDQSASGAEKERSAQALATYKRNFVHRVGHTQAIQALCSLYPSLSPAIRLVKAWAAAHLLLDGEHISEELIELLAVPAFTEPWPWDVPGSASVALARIIHRLAQWDWKKEPLIVNLSPKDSRDSTVEVPGVHKALRAADIKAIRTRFDAWRRIDPMLNRVVIFAASSVDGDGTTWTGSARPEKVIAARLSRLAQAASKVLLDDGLRVQSEALFTTDLLDFDFVVHLRTDVINEKRKRHESTAFKNLELQGITQGNSEPSDLEPVRRYVNDLRCAFGDAMILFYSPNNGDTVAGFWRPTMQERRWRAKLPVSMMPELISSNGKPPALTSANSDGGLPEKSQSVFINKPAILYEVATMGGDIVDSMVINKPL